MQKFINLLFYLVFSAALLGYGYLIIAGDEGGISLFSIIPFLAGVYFAAVCVIFIKNWPQVKYKHAFSPETLLNVLAIPVFASALIYIATHPDLELGAVAVFLLGVLGAFLLVFASSIITLFKTRKTKARP